MINNCRNIWSFHDDRGPAQHTSGSNNGIRTKLQKYVHDWYPSPNWGGVNHGVYLKGEYGKGVASKVAEISATSRARGTLSADHFSILDT